MTSNVYPLHFAAQTDNYNDVLALIEKGSDIDDTDSEGYTPLHKAVQFGHIEIVKVLIDKGAETEVYCKYQRNFHFSPYETFCPIHFAAKYGHLDILILLLNREGYDSDNYSTPLHSAAEGGQIHIIEYLLKIGKVVDANNRLEFTPLHVAAGSGQKEAVELLLDRNADINVLNENCYTPLHLAAKFGHVEVVKLLVKRGANINDKLLDNRSIPMYLAAEGNFKEIVEVLLKTEPTFWSPAESIKGYSGVHRAVQDGRTEVVKFFLDNGVNVDLHTFKGLTLLHVAAKGNREHVIQLLIERGADINYKTHSKGVTPFHYAAMCLFPRSMDVLIQYGANFNAQDNNRRTAVDILVEISNRSPGNKKVRQIIQCAKVIIKYSVLRNRLYRSQFPSHYPFGQELDQYCCECLKEINYIQECIIPNTSVSWYTFLKDTFDDTKLAVYLYNENIKNELKQSFVYTDYYKVYVNIGLILEDRLRRGLERQHFLEEADKVMKCVIKVLPAEVRLEIFSYLTIKDLKNFLRAVKENK